MNPDWRGEIPPQCKLANTNYVCNGARGQKVDACSYLAAFEVFLLNRASRISLLSRARETKPKVNDSAGSCEAEDNHRGKVRTGWVSIRHTVSYMTVPGPEKTGMLDCLGDELTSCYKGSVYASRLHRGCLISPRWFTATGKLMCKSGDM